MFSPFKLALVVAFLAGIFIPPGLRAALASDDAGITVPTSAPIVVTTGTEKGGFVTKLIQGLRFATFRDEDMAGSVHERFDFPD